MKTTIILLVIFAILYGIIQYFSTKSIENFETSILDGYLGSSNHKNGNTKDKWIKIANINMTNPTIEKTFIANVYPKLNNEELQFIIKVQLKTNNGAFMKPIISIKELSKNMIDSKIIGNIAINNNNNLITIWMQFANNWLDKFRVRYSINNFDTIDEVALTPQPMVSNLPSIGNYFYDIPLEFLSLKDEIKENQKIILSDKKIEQTKKIGNEIIYSSQNANLQLKGMITPIDNNNDKKKMNEEIKSQLETQLKEIEKRMKNKMKEEINTIKMSETKVKQPNNYEVKVSMNAEKPLFMGTSDKPLTLKVEPMSLTLKIIDDSKKSLKLSNESLLGSVAVLNTIETNDKIMKSLEKAKELHKKALENVKKAEEKIEKAIEKQKNELSEEKIEKAKESAEKAVDKVAKETEKVATKSKEIAKKVLDETKEAVEDSKDKGKKIEENSKTENK